MSKSILILETPRVCSECDFFKKYYADEYEVWDNACFILEEMIDSAEEKKHERCPLRPMLKKLDATEIAISFGLTKVPDITLHQIEGYNRCIDRILDNWRIIETKGEDDG